MTEQPPVNSLWRHRGNGKLYAVTDEVRVEHPATGEWIDGVAYQEHDGAMIATVYVRSLARFGERFERVP